MYEELDGWWHKGGNASVEKEGLKSEGAYIVFADRSRAEVEKFMRGFFACRQLLRGFFIGGSVK